MDATHFHSTVRWCPHVTYVPRVPILRSPGAYLSKPTSGRLSSPGMSSVESEMWPDQGTQMQLRRHVREHGPDPYQNGRHEYDNRLENKLYFGHVWIYTMVGVLVS